MGAHISIRRVNGRPCAIGPKAIVEAALRGTAPLTLTQKAVEGDIVYLAPKVERVWRDDAITTAHTDIADEFTHPEFGDILAAYIDTDRMESAPRLSVILAKASAEASSALATAERRIAIPSCHNCGNCPKCC
jgi:hypothetical protein